MLANPGKHSLPIGKTPDMVDRVEYTKNHVKSVIDSKIDHVLPEESRTRCFLACNRKHPRWNIQPRHCIMILQAFQDWSRSAPKLKHVLCARFCCPNKLRYLRSRSPTVSHYGVVESPETFIRCHGIIFAFLTVSEFYQKGCQEKTSASTGVEKFSRDPAHDD